MQAATDWSKADDTFDLTTGTWAVPIYGLEIRIDPTLFTVGNTWSYTADANNVGDIEIWMMF